MVCRFWVCAYDMCVFCVWCVCDMYVICLYMCLWWLHGIFVCLLHVACAHVICMSHICDMWWQVVCICAMGACDVYELIWMSCAHKMVYELTWVHVTCMCCVHVIYDGVWWYMIYVCVICVHVCTMFISPPSLSFLVTTRDAVFFSSLLPLVLGPVLKSLLFFKEGLAYNVFFWAHPVRANVLSYRSMFSCGHFSFPLKGHQESHFRDSRH